MAVTVLGLTIGDDGTGWRTPTLVQVHDAMGSWIRKTRGIANLETNPGSFFGDIIGLAAMGAEVALQSASDAVKRTIFTSMSGTTLGQFLADYLVRVEATQSTAIVYAYGTAGAAVAINTAVKTSATGTGFTYAAAVAVPAAPSIAYGIDIENFAVGAYAGQVFTVTVAGVPANYFAGAGDTGATVRDGLVILVNALAVVPDAYPGGTNPLNASRRTLLVIHPGAAFVLSVAGPGAAIVAYPAIAATLKASVFGQTYAPATSLRVGPPYAGIFGYVNVADAIVGLVAETDAQFQARHQVAQRGLGGGNPDAVRAIALASVAVGGGGARFAAVEYNPTGTNPDAAGNVDHSVRLTIGVADNGQTAANSLFRSKAAGDNTNGTETFMVLDTATPPKLHAVKIGRLTEVWIAAVITITVGPDWPATGNPLAQIAQDVADFLEAMQPSEIGVRVGDLPIGKFTNGLPRGVDKFTVSLGQSAAPGGPYVYNAAWPIPQGNAEVASINLTARQKARAQVVNIVVT